MERCVELRVLDILPALAATLLTTLPATQDSVLKCLRFVFSLHPEGFVCLMSYTIGASIIAYTLVGVPCYNSSRMGPKSLF